MRGPKRSVIRPAIAAAAAAAIAQSAWAATATLTSSKDNTLFDDPNGLISNGSGIYFMAGVTGASQIARGVVAFDVPSVIPTNAIVNSATLTVTVDRTPTSVNISMYRLLSDWGEGASDAGERPGIGVPSQPGDATWIHTFYDTAFWTNAGGDFSATSSGSRTLGQLPGPYTFATNAQLVADVQGWASGTFGNYGWLLKSDTEGFLGALRLDAHEHSIPANRPTLVVNFDASTWKTAGGSWTSSANWDFGIPNAAGAQANFTFASGSGAIAVAMSGDKTLGIANFASTNQYVLSGGVLSMQRAAGSASINVTSGSHSIASLNLASNTNVAIASASSLSVSSAFTAAAGISIAKSGAGTLAVPSVRATNLAISDGSVKTAANGGNSGVSYLKSLSIAPTAAFELNDNDLVVEYGSNPSPFSGIRDYVFAGYSPSPDPSKTGITSTTGQSAGNTILALIDNALVGAGDWPLGSGHTIDANAVIGKYTYFGDMDFDGQVTPGDYGILDANLGTTPPLGIAWLSGDADLDGSVTPGDYGILDANLGSGSSNPLSPAAVPEPASVAALSMSTVLLIRKRRAR